MTAVWPTLGSLYVTFLGLIRDEVQVGALTTHSQCEQCFYCRRGQSLLCENFNGRGVTMAGGFAEYVVL